MGLWKKQRARRDRRRGRKTAEFVQAVEEPAKTLSTLPPSIGWLLDAPLFIDEKLVEAFYDAVLRPDFEGTSVTLSDSISASTTIGSSVTVGAAIPWLAKAEGTLKAEGTDKRDEGQQAAFRWVVNPYRHLLALALHYASAQPERLMIASPPGEFIDGKGADIASSWTSQDFISRSPRALVMLELPPGAILIPAALELKDGKVVQLYDKLAEKQQHGSQPPAPAYPGSDAPVEERNKYWEWFAKGFNDRRALEVVEEAAQDSRIAWIAFRVPMNGDAGPFLHLYIAGRSEYETGVFAYNLINRGRKHGIRLVGTLKTEPDLNVLAIFER